MSKHTCCAISYSGSSYFGHACGNTAKVERDGRHYCFIHDPVRRAEKQQERQKVWDAEYEAKRKRLAEEKAEADEQKRRADCYPDLLEALRDMVEHGDKTSFEKARAAIKKATE